MVVMVDGLPELINMFNKKDSLYKANISTQQRMVIAQKVLFLLNLSKLKLL